VFLDRDGVINELVPDPMTGHHESPYRPEDVALTPGAVPGLRLLREMGASTAVVSNQPSVAKGTVGMAELRAVHEAIWARLAEAHALPDTFRYCYHHPDGTHPDLGRACDCRKPGPALILDAASDIGTPDLARSWVLGDSDVDVQAGRRAGCRTILIDYPWSAHRRGGATADARAGDLLAAARLVAAAAGERPTGEEAT